MNGFALIHQTKSADVISVWRSCSNHSSVWQPHYLIIIHYSKYQGYWITNSSFPRQKTGNSDLQNKKMRTLCLLKFTVFCVLRLHFLLSLPFPSLGSHLPQGGWGNHASALPHCAGKKQTEKRLFAEYCCVVRYKPGKSWEELSRIWDKKRQICYLVPLINLVWRNIRIRMLTSQITVATLTLSYILNMHKKGNYFNSSNEA